MVDPVPGGGGNAAAEPLIKGYLETSFLDWRGKISSVLFLGGCNFRCPFCHNFQLVSEPETLEDLSLDAVLDRLRPFVGWIDGVVITGGEPTLHEGLGRMCRRLKAAGFGVKLDTNGYRPEALEALVEGGLVDAVAMDLKAPLAELLYSRAAGRPVDVSRVRRSLEFLKARGIEHEVRSTIWPGLHGPDELAQMATEVRGVWRWTLQAMKPETAWNPEALPGGAYTSEDIDRLQREYADPVTGMAAG